MPNDQKTKVGAFWALFPREQEPRAPRGAFPAWVRLQKNSGARSASANALDAVIGGFAQLRRIALAHDARASGRRPLDRALDLGPSSTVWGGR